MSEHSSLTTEQRLTIANSAATWARSGQNTTPVDKAAIESQIKAAYKAAGLAAPEQIYWAASPLDGAVTLSIIRALTQVHSLRLASGPRIMRRISKKLRRSSYKSVTKAIDPHLALQATSILHQELINSPVISLIPNQLTSLAEAVGLPHKEGAPNCNCKACELSRGVISKSKGRRAARRALAATLSALSATHEGYWRPMRSALHRQIFDIAQAIPQLTDFKVNGPMSSDLVKRITEVIAILPQRERNYMHQNHPPYQELNNVLRNSLSTVHIVGGAYYSPGLIGSETVGYSYRASLAPFITTKRLATKLSGAEMLSNASIRLWAYKNFAVVTQPPIKASVDPQGRIHCADGPAMEFADGFKVYAWHGTGVPEDLIEGRWSVDRVLKERNTEIRRCAIEKMGWDAFIDLSLIHI